jgi:hypothetical protein
MLAFLARFCKFQKVSQKEKIHPGKEMVLVRLRKCFGENK